MKLLLLNGHGKSSNWNSEYRHSGILEEGMDKTHGLMAAGMPWLHGLKGDRGEFGDDSRDTMRKILPEIVRPIAQRAKGPRDL